MKVLLPSAVLRQVRKYKIKEMDVLYIKGFLLKLTSFKDHNVW